MNPHIDTTAHCSDSWERGGEGRYAMPTLTREQCATNAKVEINTHFGTKQQAFIEFVLAHYVSEGVQELDQDKLTPLLRLMYSNSIADAVADLGRP